MTEHVSDFKQQAFQRGLITGLVYLVLSFAFYLIFGIDYLAGSFPMDLMMGSVYWMGNLRIVPYITVMVIAFLTAFAHRRELGGYIGWKDALRSVFIVFVVAELFSALYLLLLYFVIDPGLMAEVLEYTRDKIIMFMESRDVPDDVIDDTYDRFEDQKLFRLIDIPKVYGIWVIVGFIFSAIFAAIAHYSGKKHPQAG